MTGPLANEFAQVRDGLLFQNGRAAKALARIEEHTHNTEKALTELANMDNWSMSNEDAERYGFESGPWYFDGEAEPWNVARAALSAGEGTPA